MSLTVNLWSRKAGELKKFLECFYENEVEFADSEEGWFCKYDRPLEAVDLISAVIDNADKFQIVICIQLGEGQYYHVTPANHNEIIKDIFLLFYNENKLYCN